MRSVGDVTTPSDLSLAEFAEFRALQSSLAHLEKQWLELQAGEDPRLSILAHTFDQEFQARIDQTKLIARMEAEAVEREYQAEVRRINEGFRELQESLFARTIRGYYTSYQTIMHNMEDLLGADFDAYLMGHEIEFPKAVVTKAQDMKELEEPKIAVSLPRAKQLLRRIAHRARDSSGESEDDEIQSSD